MKKIFWLFAFFPLAAFADSGGTDLESFPIDSLNVIRLQEVQVLSTRAREKTPMAYTDIDKETLSEVNYGRDVPLMLSIMPSVVTTSDAGNGIGYTSIRVRGTDPTRINVTANGIPINDSESGNVYWTNMPDIASSLESMQICRGVGTSTNGAGAFGATISMQTENIKGKPFLGVDLSAGSYSSHKETLRFGTGLIGNHWGFSARLSNIGSNGYIDRASSRLDSYFIQGGYFSQNTVVKFVTFNGKEKTYHAWNYPSKYEMELYGRRYNSCGYMYTDAEGAQHFYDNQIDLYHQQHYQLLLDQLLPHNLSLNVGLHYTRGDGYYEEYKRKRTLIEYGLSDDPNDKSDLVRRKQMENDFYGLIASINYEGKHGLRLTLGGGWNKYDGDHFGKVIWVESPVEELHPEEEYYFNNAKKVDGNIYGKLSYDFIKGLSGFLDLQYRHVGYKMRGSSDEFSWEEMQNEEFKVNDNFDFFNPKVGLYYSIGKYHDVYASFALAHKEPTRNDYEDNLNSSLKAERLVDWEWGYKFHRLRYLLGVNFYLMRYANQFVLTGEKDNIGDMIARNVGKSYRLGLEVESSWTPVDFFSWVINFTLSKNRAKDWHVTDGLTGESLSLGSTPISFSPGFILGNAFHFDYKGFKAIISSKYVGRQYLTNTGIKSYESYSIDGIEDVSMVIDPHFTTDLDLSYTFKVKGIKAIRLGCTIYNIFSAKYMNNGWSSPYYTTSSDGKVIAYTNNDKEETGYAVSCPINFLAHFSIDF